MSQVNLRENKERNRVDERGRFGGVKYKYA